MATAASAWSDLAPGVDHISVVFVEDLPDAMSDGVVRLPPASPPSRDPDYSSTEHGASFEHRR
jgi:hypothetical protein